MADAEANLVSFILADTNFTALCGDRIFPAVIPQEKALPAVAHQVISDVPEVTHDGAVAGANRVRVQLTILANLYSEVKAVKNVLESRLSGYRGVFGAGTVGGVFIENSYAGYGEEAKRHVWRMDILIESGG
jgi:hypothetical protein